MRERERERASGREAEGSSLLNNWSPLFKGARERSRAARENLLRAGMAINSIHNSIPLW